MAVSVRTEAGFQAGTPRRLFPANVIQSTIGRNRYAVFGDGSRFLLLSPNSAETLEPTTLIVNWAAEIARR
jgi:hypothetical protein